MGSWGMLFLCLAAGILLGMFYFLGLWWTVSRLPQSPRPLVLSVVSFLVRTGLVLVGFYFIARGGHWENLIASLVGFILARIILVQRLAPRSKNTMVKG